MTDRAAAARPGCAGVCRVRVVPARRRCHAGLSSVGTGSRPAVSERLVCPGVRVPLSRLALSLSKRPGSPSVGFINRRFLLRITTGYICGKRSAYLCAIAAWRVDSFAFLSVHRAWIVLSQVMAPVMGATRQRDPQHFPNVRTGPAPFYTGDPHGCAQQNLRHVRVPGWQAAAGQRGGACARRSARRTRYGLGLGDIAHDGSTGCSPHAL
jgi:hypothetical protein